MYAKLINNIPVEAPYYINRNGIDVFGYNLESNSKMLIEDGYKLVIDSEAPSNLNKPIKFWKETKTEILAYWIEGEPELPLSVLKLQKRDEINKERDKAEQNGFEYLGKIFDSDVISCVRIQGAAQLAALSTMTHNDTNIEWTCKDNTTINLTPTELLGLSAALAQWSNECHKKATELKEKIEKAQTKEELDEIVW